MRPDPLGFMPGPLGDQARRIGIELQTDPAFPSRRKYAETSAPNLADGKVCRPVKTPGRQGDVSHAGESKRSQLFSVQIFRKEVPLILEAAQVIRTDSAQFVLAAL